MAICERLQRSFYEEEASYRLVPHAEAFTATRVAAASHAPGREMVKVVMLRDDRGAFLMAVLPASTRLDVDALMWAMGGLGFRLATEAEFGPLFPDCEVGAMPPFGALYGMRMYLDPCLADFDEIVFQAGSHREVVVMSYREYARVAHSAVGRYCIHRLSTRAAS
jgi:Ala-tRNA(Pro) deacylase